MEPTGDKHWASKYLLDPLNEPEPSAETGPGTSFRPESTASVISEAPSRSTSARLQKNNPYRKSSSASKNPFISASEVGQNESKRPSYPSPPQSASPRRDHFADKRQASAPYSDNPEVPADTGAATKSKTRQRGSSLNERFPGDKSHRPLETIKQERKIADRAPHLRRNHQIRPDTIDSLDSISKAYHHEGPYDATYQARNTSYQNSPLEALAASNEEALKATPRERIVDSVEKHRPLDGVASYAPGETDRNGQLYRYEQGENMMVDGNPEGGAYKRWPGVQYHPDDIKGKGEPSYSIEKALKDNPHRDPTSHRQQMSQDIEMTSRPRSAGHDHGRGRSDDMWDDGEESRFSRGDGVGRSNTTGGKRLSGGNGTLRKRFGSIRRSMGGKKDD